MDALVVLLVSVAASLAGVWLGGRISAKSAMAAIRERNVYDDRTWHRREKLRVYADLQTLLDAFWQLMARTGDQTVSDELRERVVRTTMETHLLCNPTVSRLVRESGDVLGKLARDPKGSYKDEWMNSLSALGKAMRADLGTSE